MAEMLVIEEQVGEDGQIVLRLQPGAHVRITIEKFTPEIEEPLSADEEAALDANLEALLNDPMTLKGQGLTAGEIANSPEFGILADENITDGASYVEELRRKRKRYTW